MALLTQVIVQAGRDLSSRVGTDLLHLSSALTQDSQLLESAVQVPPVLVRDSENASECTVLMDDAHVGDLHAQEAALSTSAGEGPHPRVTLAQSRHDLGGLLLLEWPHGQRLDRLPQRLLTPVAVERLSGVVPSRHVPGGIGGDDGQGQLVEGAQGQGDHVPRDSRSQGGVHEALAHDSARVTKPCCRQ